MLTMLLTAQFCNLLGNRGSAAPIVNRWDWEHHMPGTQHTCVCEAAFAVFCLHCLDGPGNLVVHPPQQVTSCIEIISPAPR